MKTPFALLARRRFAPLFVTQFFGAFNDNVFKNALVVLLTFKAAAWTSLSASTLANLAAGLFILPFFLFSATAGQWADKHDKARLARFTKWLELAIVGIAGAGFWLHSLPVLLIALFLLGTQSALFGPVKYAILPQHLREDELLGGNALVEAATFVSILLGTILGGVLAALDGGTAWNTATSFAVAVAGLLASLAIPPAPPPSPTLKVSADFLGETWRSVRRLAAQPPVLTAVLGISWFWLSGALLLAQFPAFGRDVLGGDESVVTLLLAVFTVGVGLGSLACERFSRGHLALGWVSLGALGISGSTWGLAWAATQAGGAAAISGDGALMSAGSWLAAPGSQAVAAGVLAVGAFGGLFIVPLYTRLQTASEAASRARAIAANNIVNALFMVAGALAAGVLLAAGLSIPALFALVAALNLWVLWRLVRREAALAGRFARWLGGPGGAR
jgi:MFS family permease